MDSIKEEFESKFKEIDTEDVNDKGKDESRKGEHTAIELDCPICLCLLCKPVTLHCGHSACESCMAQYIVRCVATKAPGGYKCPAGCMRILPSAIGLPQVNHLLVNIIDNNGQGAEYRERLLEVAVHDRLVAMVRSGSYNSLTKTLRVIFHNEHGVALQRDSPAGVPIAGNSVQHRALNRMDEIYSEVTRHLQDGTFDRQVQAIMRSHRATTYTPSSIPQNNSIRPRTAAIREVTSRPTNVSTPGTSFVPRVASLATMTPRTTHVASRANATQISSRTNTTRSIPEAMPAVTETPTPTHTTQVASRVNTTHVAQEASPTTVRTQTSTHTTQVSSRVSTIRAAQETPPATTGTLTPTRTAQVASRVGMTRGLPEASPAQRWVSSTRAVIPTARRNILPIRPSQVASRVVSNRTASSSGTGGVSVNSKASRAPATPAPPSSSSQGAQVTPSTIQNSTNSEARPTDTQARKRIGASRLSMSRSAPGTPRVSALATDNDSIDSGAPPSDSQVGTTRVGRRVIPSRQNSVAAPSSAKKLPSKPVPKPTEKDSVSRSLARSTAASNRQVTPNSSLSQRTPTPTNEVNVTDQVQLDAANQPNQESIDALKLLCLAACTGFVLWSLEIEEDH